MKSPAIPSANPATPETAVAPAAPRLRRVLSVWDLFFCGLVAVQPCAPATIFGEAQVRSHGHVVVTILAAMVTMVLTAISYGRMAALYPSAGSAYTYVGRGLHPYLGFVAGWAMLLDYIISPLICTVFGTLSLQRLVPALPSWAGVALFSGLMTFLNLRGIRSTARANQVLLVFMCAVLIWYVAAAIRFLLLRDGAAGLFSTVPFYNPATFKVSEIASATSFAALTYLGFDAVTTLAEDVHNPRRSVMVSAVAVCVFTGLFGGLLVYLAQLAWPDYAAYPNVETAFIDATRQVGGFALFQAVGLMLVVAAIGAGLATQVGAARLLFGMGRDNVIPRRFFGVLHPVRNTPNRNLWLIGGLAFGLGLFMNYGLTVEMLNFGAFLGFMGVNLAVIWQFWVRRVEGHRRGFFADLVLPGLGFLMCSVIWLGLSRVAFLVGGAWFLVGMIVLVTHTRWFRHPLALPDPASYS